MFTLVGADGIHSPYVPGLIPRRKIVKVSKAVGPAQVKTEGRSFPSDDASPQISHYVQAYERALAFAKSTQTKIVARDLMSSPVITLPVMATLAQAWDLVHTRRFRHIPIVSPENSLVGILSDRDLLRGTVNATVLGFQQSKDPSGFHLLDSPHCGFRRPNSRCACP